MKATWDAPIRTEGALLDRVLADRRPTLVSFEAPRCGPCVSLGLALEVLAREFAGRVRFVRVTDATEGWVAARWHIAYVPTLVFLTVGEELARIRGDPGRAALRDHLEYLLGQGPRPEPADGPRHTLRARFGRGRPDDSGTFQPAALLFRGR